MFNTAATGVASLQSEIKTVTVLMPLVDCRCGPKPLLNFMLRRQSLLTKLHGGIGNVIILILVATKLIGAD